MSNLDDAMKERMAYIVFIEHRPFSYMDFLDLMKPKTYRNKVSKLNKDGIVELDYKTSVAFYTLKGHRFGKAGTSDHTGVSVSHNDPVCNMLRNLPMDKQSIHDINLHFNASNIYKTVENTPFPKFKVNESIAIESWTMNNAITKTTINKNDTVDVIIGCSLEPIPLDYNGIIRFFTILARAEGVLHGLTAMVNNYRIGNESIPSYSKWIITRWDFGRDSIESYKGKKFEITVEDAQHRFYRLYTKDFDKNRRLRAEIIETPRVTAVDAIQEKLNIQNL